MTAATEPCPGCAVDGWRGCALCGQTGRVPVGSVERVTPWCEAFAAMAGSQPDGGGFLEADTEDADEIARLRSQLALAMEWGRRLVHYLDGDPGGTVPEHERLYWRASAVRSATRAERERDEARAERDRMRAVVKAARSLMYGQHSPPGAWYDLRVTLDALDAGASDE